MDFENSEEAAGKKLFARSIIEKRSQTSSSKPKSWFSKILFGVVFIVIIFYFFQAAFSVWGALANFSPWDVLWSFSTNLEITDGKTNFILLGRGGGNHPGANLTDTILVVSLNHKKKTVSMLSIPRDMYVNIRGYGDIRINEVYVYASQQGGPTGGNEMISRVVSEMLGMPMHYYVNVDFTGFSKMIDALGGIDVDVEREFTDNKYPNDKTLGWMTVEFAKGINNLDGFNTLAFARSRHGNNGEGSDFARARRQQIVLAALRERLDNMEWLSSGKLLTSFFEILEQNMDTNLTVREVISLGQIARLVRNENIFMKLLTDGYDGFLYAPSETAMTEFYNGKFVLLPVGNDYTRIQKFAQIISNYPEIMIENAKIEILNGTGEGGTASSCARNLRRYGFNVPLVGNADHNSYVDTYIIDHTANKSPITMFQLSKFTNGTKQDSFEGVMATSSDITIILGEGELCSRF